MSNSRANGMRIHNCFNAVAFALAAATVAATPAAAQNQNITDKPIPLGSPTPLVTAGSGSLPIKTGSATGAIPLSSLIPKKTGDIEINPLAEIAPEAIGILDLRDGGFGIDMWRGTDRSVVENLLPRLSGNITSPTMRDLARRLLLSNAAPPLKNANNNSGESKNLLALRIERLAALGEIAGLNGVLRITPQHNDDETIARARVDGFLLAQDVEGACRQVRNGISTYYAVAYWSKALVFCQLVDGEIDQAMLGLDLLREQGTADDPAFFALAEAVLRVSAGDSVSGKSVLAGIDSKNLPPLHNAMLLAAGLPIPPEQLEQAGTGLLVAVAMAPTVLLEQRALAAEKAVASGALEADVLAAIYSGFSFSAEEEDAALSQAGTLDGPRGRALLYQLARKQTLPTTQAEVLRVVLDTAREQGHYQTVVPVFLPILEEVPALPELVWFAEAAGRALYVSGRFEHASAWLTLSRQEAIINPLAAAAVTALWPYSRLAGATTLTNDGNLASWRAARDSAGSTESGSRQALLRACFQALGGQDPLPWSQIAAADDAVPRPVPQAALLYAMEDASEGRRIGETVLLALLVLGDAGPQGSHTMALSEVLSALGKVGLDAEARALAIEAAAASGI